MQIRSLILLLAVAALPGSAARAQHGAAGPPLVTTAPREAKQFDFLIGQWELVAEPKVSVLAATFHGQPRLPGTWRAWRGFDGFGVEDEMRLTDDAGNPRALAHCVRVYDRSAQQWNLSTLDVYKARFQAATARWQDNQMILTARSTGEDGRAVVSRIRFYDIRPNSFRWQQDRSYDDGRTWDEATLKIEATRVAAAAPR